MAGNWKMYKTPEETRVFFEKFNPQAAAASHCEIVIFPPYVNLQAASDAARGTRIEVGGQNMHWAKEGAYTGEISAAMLRSVGCQWVLIAHSERRQYFGETNANAARKIAAALEAGLKPMYCIGETLEQREAGKTHEVLERDFAEGTAGLSADQMRSIALAYEPVWAIGTGRVATPEIAADAHRFIREQLRLTFGAEAAAACRILYGGSVKPDNIRGLMAQPEIDGALVGGASLDPASFGSIVNF